jgi:hypothetical protein
VHVTVAAAYQIDLSPARVIGRVITPEHLGANTIYTRNFLDRGGPYDRLFEDLEFGLLRFPGGTVTEERFAPGGTEIARLFDTTRPAGFGAEGEARIVTAPAFFAYAAEKDVPVKFVLPTENYFGTGLDDDGFRTPSAFGVYELLRHADDIIRGVHGETEIETFVIGNEFWYKKERQTPEEYGRMADTLATGLERVFKAYAASGDAPDGWSAPQIGIQVGQGWRPEQNDAILRELSPEARGSIDVLIQHFYPSQYHQVQNSPGTFDRLDDFRAAEGFGDLKYYVSEWNTSVREDADTGLLQSSTMLEIMRMMLSRDVEYASIWGTQYANLPNRLSALARDSGDPSGFSATLTPAGEIFRMMSQSLVGTRALDLDTPGFLRETLAQKPEDRPEDRPEDGRDQMVMHAFQGADKTIVFLSSRSDGDMRVTLDYRDLVPEYTHLWGQRLSVIDDPATAIDEGDPTSPFAKPHVGTMTEDEMARGDLLSLTFGPYEIIRLEFTMNSAGVEMRGHDQMVDPAADHDDTLIGGAGDDLIRDFLGDNLLRGGAGNDTIIGGIGDDTLRGGEGDDLLIGSGGVAHVLGGTGSDTLVGGHEGGVIEGGTEGVKHFVVSVTGDTVVEGFRPDEGHTLSFLRAYGSIEEVRDTLDIDGEDLLLRHEAATTRLVGAADRIDFLDASLSDFMESSPVSALLDDLLAEAPDGTPMRDAAAPPDDDPNAPLDAAQFADLLDVTDAAGLAGKLDTLSPAQIAGFADMLNPTIYALSAPPDVFVELLNRLDGETLEDFVAGLSPDAITAKLADQSAGAEMRVAWALLSDEAMMLLADHLSPAPAPHAEQPGADQHDTLHSAETGTQAQALAPPETAGMFGVAGAGMSVTRAAEADEFPLRAIPPEEDERALFETLDAQAEAQVAQEGGGCFIATVAYADPFHSDVVYLRRFRERYLRPCRIGRLFIAAYNAGGPVLARVLRPHPRGRGAVRWVLSQFVAWMIRREAGAGGGGDGITGPEPGNLRAARPCPMPARTGPAAARTGG